MEDLKFNVSPERRVIFLLCVTVLCYIVASFIAAVVLGKGLSATRVCIVTVVQDMLVFIVPSIVTAMLITRRPADFLSLTQRPGVLPSVLALCALVLSIPAMNLIIQWNASLTLPAGMSDFARWMRAMEDSAAQTIGAMVNGESVMSLVLMILVVGVFAGISEELFFRGAVQRMLITSRVNPHVAIWATAFLFSAVHVQFFGFVPRLLLGALFGYMAWWSGSVWLSALAHVTNNTLAAISMWMSSRVGDDSSAYLETVGAESYQMFVVSAVLTGFALYGLYCVTRKSALRQ